MLHSVPNNKHRRFFTSALFTLSVMLFSSCAASVPTANNAHTNNNANTASRTQTDTPTQGTATWATRITQVSGTIRYEDRHPTPTGASRSGKMKPGRLLRLRTVDDAGNPLTTAHTDNTGQFLLTVPTEAHHVELLAQIHAEDMHLAVTQDGSGEQVYTQSLALTDFPTDGTSLALDFSNDTPIAGALHILDTLLNGTHAVQRWSHRTLPPFFVYWNRGGTNQWSFYRGEIPAGTGKYSVELLGRDPRTHPEADTDEHDETIILHEFGHFVMDQLTTNSSHGGNHPDGSLLDPGLAWEEGRASWFAAAVLKTPLYIDTIGVEPAGKYRVRRDLERGGDPGPRGIGPRGIGSETGVMEILWDLTDGVDGYPDVDRDGVALGPAPIFQAMIDLGKTPGSFPVISTFLRFLIDKTPTDLNDETVRALLGRGGHPEDMLLAQGIHQWPINAQLNQVYQGRIDSISNPAPSGGRPCPRNGLDAVHMYRVHVTRPGRLRVHLTIQGSGNAQSRSDIDLELRDEHIKLLIDSKGTGATEEIQRQLAPGYYMIYVRDAGTGTQSDYELRVDLL